MGFLRKMINHVIYYVCVDQVDESSDIVGRLYHCYTMEAIAFRTSIDFICKMDEFMNRINYPQRSTQGREFVMRQKEIHNKGYEDTQQIVKLVEEYEMMENRGEKATFVVEIKYRENTTWQGNVEWIEGGKKQAFRSALELIKLIDSVNVEEEQK